MLIKCRIILYSQNRVNGNMIVKKLIVNWTMENKQLFLSVIRNPREIMVKYKNVIWYENVEKRLKKKILW